MALGRKVAVYCSDVSGAFDRVRAERLIAKLRAWRIHDQIIEVIKSWLRQRTANIVVGGDYSDAMALLNMVFQGTVLGPMLWNMFFEDARRAIKELHEQVPQIYIPLFFIFVYTYIYIYMWTRKPSGCVHSALITTLTALNL
jgi:hypothetical protein